MSEFRDREGRILKSKDRKPGQTRTMDGLNSKQYKKKKQYEEMKEREQEDKE